MAAHLESLDNALGLSMNLASQRQTFTPGLDILAHHSQTRSRAGSLSPPSAHHQHTRSTPNSPPRFYAPTCEPLPSELSQRARSVSMSHLAPTLVFPAFRATGQSVFALRTLDTSPALRHILESHGTPLLEFRQRRLARKTIRVFCANSGAEIAQLKRTKTTESHGRAILAAVEMDATLATLDYTRAPFKRDLDLDLSIAQPAMSPTSPPLSAGSLSPATSDEELPGARAALALRVRSDGDGYASMAYAGHSLARFNRRPRLVGNCEVVVDAGADIAFVACAAVAAMYALEGRDDDVEPFPGVPVPAFASPRPGMPELHFDEPGQPVGTQIKAADRGGRRRGSSEIFGSLIPGRRSFSGVGMGTDSPPIVAGRRSVSGTRGRWEGVDML